MPPPLRSASIFLIVHHSTTFRVDLLVPSELNVGLLTVCNFCHNVSKTSTNIYAKNKSTTAKLPVAPSRNRPIHVP
uniref:Uncharacterized protein n=1 Tax=Rhizophora mucronata TaxID=61149 RepID=A0A2P2LU73_RHIMU